VTTRDFDAPIAHRELVQEGSDHAIHVFIWQPFEEEDNVWVCPYQIKGLGDEATRYVRGADALQALQLSFAAVLADLDPKRNRIHWIASEIPDAGFPRTVPWTSGNELYERLGEMIDRELLAEQQKMACPTKERRQRPQVASRPKGTNQRKRPKR
jgi:hypothetical protein